MRTVWMILALSLFGCDLDENRSAQQDTDDASVNQTNTSGRQLDASTDAGRVEDGGMLPSDGYLVEGDALVVDLDAAPPSPSCEDACRDLGAQTEQRCIADGGGADDCRLAGMRAVRNCIGRRCSELDGGAGEQSCEDRCREAGRTAERQCLADGGDVDDCRLAGMRAVRNCIGRRCSEMDGGTGEQRCEDRCREAGRTAERQCLADGGDADECRSAGMRAVRNCIERRCSQMDGGAGEQRCEDRCREAGRTTERQCLADGGDADECRLAGMRAVRNCIERRCGEMDGGTGEQRCEDRCSEAGRTAERQCLADGGEANNCRQVAMEVQHDCVSARCDVQDAGTEPADCESACRQSARDVQQDCLRSGGREEMCSRRAREQYRMCTETRCGDSGVVEAGSRACIRDCIESGGDRAECFAQCGESP